MTAAFRVAQRFAAVLDAKKLGVAIDALAREVKVVHHAHDNGQALDEGAAFRAYSAVVDSFRDIVNTLDRSGVDSRQIMGQCPNLAAISRHPFIPEDAVAEMGGQHPLGVAVAEVAKLRGLMPAMQAAV